MLSLCAWRLPRDDQFCELVRHAGRGKRSFTGDIKPQSPSTASCHHRAPRIHKFPKMLFNSLFVATGLASVALACPQHDNHKRATLVGRQTSENGTSKQNDWAYEASVRKPSPSIILSTSLMLYSSIGERSTQTMHGVKWAPNNHP